MPFTEEGEFSYVIRRVLERQPVQNPGEDEPYADKFREYLCPVSKTFQRFFPAHYAENYRHESREYNHDQEMSHFFLPAAISNASSMFR